MGKAGLRAPRKAKPISTKIVGTGKPANSISQMVWLILPQRRGGVWSLILFSNFPTQPLPSRQFSMGTYPPEPRL